MRLRSIPMLVLVLSLISFTAVVAQEYQPSNQRERDILAMPKSQAKSDSLSTLIDLYFNSNPETTLALFRVKYVLDLELGNRENAALVLTDMALTEMELGQIEEARSLLDSAMVLAEEVNTPKAFMGVHRARVYLAGYTNDREGLEASYKEAEASMTEIKDWPHLATIQLMMGYFAHDLEGRRSWFRRSFETLDTLKDRNEEAERALLIAQLNLANALQSFEPDSVIALNLSIIERSEMLADPEPGITARLNLADFWQSIGQSDEAKVLYLQAIDDAKRFGYYHVTCNCYSKYLNAFQAEQDSTWLRLFEEFRIHANSVENEALVADCGFLPMEVLYMMRNEPDAMVAQKVIEAMNVPFFVKAAQTKRAGYSWLAEYYTRNDDRRMAIDALDSTRYYCGIGIPSLNDWEHYYRVATEVYKELGLFEKAVESSGLRVLYKDSIHNFQTKAALINAERKYRSEKQALLIDTMQTEAEIREENNRFKLLTLSSVSGGLLLLMALGVLSYRNRKTKETLAIERQKDALLNQVLHSGIDQHFVANVVQRVQQLVRQGEPAAADDYLEKTYAWFTEQLRIKRDMDEITLESELNLARAYLDLQQVNTSFIFDYSVNVEQGIDPKTTLVAPMLLQPLLENALKYGQPNNTKGFALTIQVYLRSGLLHLDIIDNGIHESGSGTTVPGIGVSTELLNQRLALYAKTHKCDARYELQIGNGQTTASITFPHITL